MIQNIAQPLSENTTTIHASPMKNWLIILLLKLMLDHGKLWRHWSSIISLIVWSVHVSQAKREDSLMQKREIQIITTAVRDAILYPIIYLLFSYAYDLKSFVFTYNLKSIIHNSWENIVCTFYSFQKSRNISVLNVLPNEIFIQSIYCIHRCSYLSFTLNMLLIKNSFKRDIFLARPAILEQQYKS